MAGDEPKAIWIWAKRLCFVFSFAGLLAGGLGAATAAPPRNPHGWSERGLFVFGDIVFDFWERKWRMGPFAHALDDCSNAEFYCARTEAMPVTVPKTCRKIRVGDEWATEGVVTRVIAEVKQEGEPARTFYYLATPGRGDFVYAYHEREGILRVYYDETRKMNFVQLARKEGALRELRVLEFSRVLTTFEAFGGCRGAVN